MMMTIIFGYVYISCKVCLLASLCLSACISAFPIGFSWNLILGTLWKSVEKIQNLVKIGQKYQALYMKT